MPIRAMKPIGTQATIQEVRRIHIIDEVRAPLISRPTGQCSQARIKRDTRAAIDGSASKLSAATMAKKTTTARDAAA